MSYVKNKIRNFAHTNELNQVSKSSLSIDDFLGNIRKQCTATNKTNKKRCKARAIKGTSKCKMHGGLSTGPKTPEGKAKALKNLKQYRDK